MSMLDTDRETVPVTTYVGWLWATGSLAILGWLGGLTLIAVDASLYNLPDTIVAGVLILAGCATVICTQTALAYAQRVATRATGQAVTHRTSASATTLEMQRISVGHTYGASHTVPAREGGLPGWPAADRDDLRRRLTDSVPLDEARQMNAVSFELGKRIERRRHDES